jgi:heat shock protein HslJ
MRCIFFLSVGLPLLLISCQNSQSPQAAPAASTATRAQPAATLRETRWVLRQVAGQPVNVPDDTNEPYLVLRADGSAEGNGACNRFRGKYFTEQAGELKFSPLLSTRMACPALATETAFTAALQRSQTYRISGDTLGLYGESAALLARLEAVHLH